MNAEIIGRGWNERKRESYGCSDFVTDSGGIPKSSPPPGNSASVRERLDLSCVRAIDVAATVAGVQCDVDRDNRRRVREVKSVNGFDQISLRVVDLNAA